MLQSALDFLPQKNAFDISARVVFKRKKKQDFIAFIDPFSFLNPKYTNNKPTNDEFSRMQGQNTTMEK